MTTIAFDGETIASDAVWIAAEFDTGSCAPVTSMDVRKYEEAVC